MILNLSDVSSEPLYEQIVSQIRSLILCGNLPPGTSIPSIRELARSSKISVITVQKAYENLTRNNLLIARRGKGYFVAELPQKKKKDIAREKCRNAFHKSVSDALAEGLRSSDIRKILVEVIDAETNQYIVSEKVK